MKKEDFKKTLKDLGLTQVKFAELSEMSKDTVTNWNNTTKPIPAWVRSWLDNYKKALAGQKIIDAVKPFVSKESIK